MTTKDVAFAGYLTTQVRRVESDGAVALRDALRVADRLSDVATRIVADVDRRDLGAIRARLRELIHVLPHDFAQVDDHLKEAEIFRRLAADVRSWEGREAAR